MTLCGVCCCLSRNLELELAGGIENCRRPPPYESNVGKSCCMDLLPHGTPLHANGLHFGLHMKNGRISSSSNTVLQLVFLSFQLSTRYCLHSRQRGF